MERLNSPRVIGCYQNEEAELYSCARGENRIYHRKDSLGVQGLQGELQLDHGIGENKIQIIRG